MLNASVSHALTLPRPLTSFVGRETELAEIKALLLSSPLLTLTGPGGGGKTRLALRLATDLGGTFAHGLAWTDLGDLSDPSFVIQAVALALDVHEQPGQPLLDTLIDFLQDRETLLVLDSCEHVVEACAILAETLLQACPNLWILATSREALGAMGETVWVAPPLPPDAAMQLFVERARAVQPTFSITPQNEAAVAQICERLDGIPLAIELAAARVRVLSPDQIARRLDDVFRLLIGSDRSAAPRHQTLRATIEWSYTLLSDPERVLLRRLSVFVGGFTLEAAEEVTGDSEQVKEEREQGEADRSGNLSLAPYHLFPEDILDLLTRLVDKSLVVRLPGDRVARYRMIETVRQYARDRLAETGEAAAMQPRHAAAYLRLAETAEPHLGRIERDRWLERLEEEQDNLRAALKWGLEDSLADDIGLRLAGALWRFWFTRIHLSEGLTWLRLALTTADLRRPTTADPLTLAPDRWRAARAKALTGAGVLGRLVGDYAAARTWLEEAVAQWRILGDTAGLAHALAHLGRIVMDQGDAATAHSLAAESLALFRRVDDPYGLGLATYGLGNAALGAGDLVEARRRFEESRDIWRAIQYDQTIAVAVNSLGEVSRMERRYAEAALYYEEALRLCDEVRDPWRHAMAQHNLAYAVQHLGDLERAAALFRDSLGRWQRLGAQRGTAMCLAGLAANATLTGAYAIAARLIGATDALLVTLQATLDITDRDELEQHRAQAQAALGETRWADLWADGRDLSVAKAVELALTVDGKPTADRRPPDTRRPLEVPDGGHPTPDDPWKSPTGDTQHPTTLGSPRRGTPNTRRPLEVPDGGHPTPDTRLASPSGLTLRILGLGRAEVYRDGTLLTPADWTVAKAREMLFFLLAHPPQSRDQIGLALWPDALPSQWSANSRTTLHRLRRALGGSDWVVFQDEVYSFNRSLPYFYDVEAFEAKIKAWKVERDMAGRPGALQPLEEAVALYRGEFLEDLSGGDWIEERREALRQLYLDARLTLGQAMLDADRPAAAADHYRHALGQDNYLEEAHRGLIRSYARLGEVSQALQHYQDMARVFRDELGVQPEAETRGLVRRLRQGEAV